jgi:HK97 family phage portal protein
MAVFGFDKFFGWFSPRALSGQRNSGKQAASAGAVYASAGVNVNAASAMAVSAVFAAVARYAETISCMSLTLRDLDDEGKAVGTNRRHDLARLFAHKPNRYQTATSWLQVVVSQLRLHNNAYCVIDYAKPNDTRSRVTALTPLMSDQMQVTLERTGDLTYEYTQDGLTRIYAESQILHIKVLGNGIVGESPLSAAAENIGLSISARNRAAKFARNGFKPTAVLMSEQLLDERQRDAIKERFRLLTESQDDTLHVLEAGLKYQALSMSPADAQLLESRKFETREIARFFNVPPALIGEEGTFALGADFESTMEAFYRLSLQPFCELIEAELTAKLLKVEERGTLRFAFNADDLLKLTPAKLHTTVKEQVQGGICTPNEGRQRLGLPPSDDANANYLYMQQQMVRLGQGGGGGAVATQANNNNNKPA